MSADNEHKSSQSWFKAATICAAFAVVAASPVIEAQPASDVMHAAVFAKNEHRKLLERKIDLTCALAGMAGSSQETVNQFRAEATGKLDADSTGDPDAMRRVAADNRKLEQNIHQMNKALSVSRA
jgi:hypothetical protein